MTRLWFTTIVCVIGLGLIIQANIAHAKLEDILYEKGDTKRNGLRQPTENKRPLFNNAHHPKWYENSAFRYTQFRHNYITDDKN
jgi:hypothetical protein